MPGRAGLRPEAGVDPSAAAVAAWGERIAPPEHRESWSEQAVPFTPTQVPGPDLGLTEGGVVHALREAARRSGMDPVAELYNEALQYANGNHLRLARERLQILLCMAPDDGEAHLTLARVYAAGHQWKDALTELEAAAQAGANVPASFRRGVDDHLRAERESEEQQRRVVRDRDDTEVRALRAEAKRLRADNAQQVAQIAQLRREVSRWAWLTAAVSTLAIGFIAVTFTFGRDPVAESGTSGAGTDRVQQAAALPALEPAPAPVVAPPLDLRPAPGTSEAILLDRVNAALMADVATAGLTPALTAWSGSASTITLRGEVPRYRDLRTAIARIAAVDPKVTVVDEDVVFLARTKGAEHRVEAGESMRKIALDYYGDPASSKILEARNDLIGKPVPAGRTIIIPPITR